MSRGAIVSIRLTDSEHAELEARAAESGVSVSAYLRSTALSRSRPAPTLPEHDLARIAVRLQQQAPDAPILIELRDALRRL